MYVYVLGVCVCCVRACVWFLFTVCGFYKFVMLFVTLSPWHLYLFEPPTTFLDLISFVVYLRDKRPPQHRRPQWLAACAWSTPCWRNSSALLEYFQQSLVGFRWLPFRAAPWLMHRWRRRRVVYKLDLEHLSVRPKKLNIEKCRLVKNIKLKSCVGSDCVKCFVLQQSLTWNTLYGSFSCTSNAAALIRPCFNANARVSSSTRPPRAVLTRNAPGRIY